MFTTNRNGCRMCMEPFQHKTLIPSRDQIDSILTLSRYEIEIIPLLWERILKINAYFCEHVAHSWSLKQQRKDDEIYRLITELTEEEYSMIRNESQRLEMMLSETIAEIRNTGKLNQKSEIFYGYARSFDIKNQTKWRLPIRGRRQINWNLMAEALIEEFCALSQSEDVHTKQLCILIWKHFIHAVSHCVCQ